MILQSYKKNRENQNKAKYFFGGVQKFGSCGSSDISRGLSWKRHGLSWKNIGVWWKRHGRARIYCETEKQPSPPAPPAPDVGVRGVGGEGSFWLILYIYVYACTRIKLNSWTPKLFLLFFLCNHTMYKKKVVPLHAWKNKKRCLAKNYLLRRCCFSCSTA